MIEYGIQYWVDLHLAILFSKDLWLVYYCRYLTTFFGGILYLLVYSLSKKLYASKSAIVSFCIKGKVASYVEYLWLVDLFFLL